MGSITCAIVLAALGVDPPQVEPAHARNSVYTELLGPGWKDGGPTVTLPPPRLRDGQDAGVQRAALRDMAGSDRALEDLLR